LLTQRTFFVDLGSMVSVFGRNLPLLKSSGMPLASATMLRLGVPPHIGQSAACDVAVANRAATSEQKRGERMLFIGGDGKVIDENAFQALW
jgi:hypothetical protein